MFRNSGKNADHNGGREYLHISQPAVTKRLQNLEQEFGIRLFQRVGRRLMLSQAGQELLPLAERIVDECTLWKNIAGEKRAGAARTVHISLKAASAYMPEILKRFRENYPEIAVEVLQGPSNQADLCLDATHLMPHEDGVRILLKEQVVLAVPAGSEFVKRGPLPLAELKDCRLISLCVGRSMREAEEYFCGKAGFSPQRMVECDTPGTLRNLVKQGVGCAFSAELTWFVEPHAEISLVPFDPPCWRYVTLRIAKGRNDPSVLRMADEITEFFEGLAHTTMSG